METAGAARPGGCFGVFAAAELLAADDLSERVVDPVLPARAGFLKVIENLPVKPQRHQLLGIGNARPLRRQSRGLCRRLLERRFGRIPRAGGSSCSVGGHFMSWFGRNGKPLSPDSGRQLCLSSARGLVSP